MKKLKNRICLLLSLLALPAVAQAATDGDFDGDGTADFALAEVNRRARTTSFFILTTKGVRLNRYIGAQGDAIVPGDYDGDGITQPGVVYVQPDGNLAWYILDSTNWQSVGLFGVNGDKPLVGDLDCDGKDDRTVTRKVGSATRWLISFSGGGTGDVLHGLSTDTTWVGDTNGDGCDEMVLSRKKNNALYFYPRQYGSTATEIQWGAENDTPMRPFDINGDGKDDLIVVRRIGNNDFAFVRYSASSFQSFNLGRAGNVTLTGDFNADGYGDFLRFAPTTSARGISQFVLAPAAAKPPTVKFGRSNHALVRPDGTIVQPGDGISSGGGGGGAGGCSVTREWEGGNLWKPVSDSKGRPVVLLGSSYLRGVRSGSVVGRTGSEVATLANRNYLGNGNRSHFDVSKSARDLSSAKPLTVKLRMTDATVECLSVPDPTKRYD